MCFCRFPDELQILVLSFLPFHVIKRSRRLCKRICALIDSSKELDFIIKLGEAGMKNNPACPDARITKSIELDKYNVAWANLHWQFRRRIEIGKTAGKVYDLSDGCFFHIAAPPAALATEALETGTTIDWLKLPSRREPNPDNKSSNLYFNVELESFAVDASRDLIIGIELGFTRKNNIYSVKCSLHCRSISTNEVHPDAAQPVISMRFDSPVTQFKLVAQLCGSHIGVLLTGTRGDLASFDMFLLMDFTTGTQKSIMRSNHAQEYWESFCFLTTESVLIPSACSQALNIFEYGEASFSLKHVLTLLLPEINKKNELLHLLVRSQPTPAAFPTAARHPKGDIPPFTADPDEAIVVISIKYRLGPAVSRRFIDEVFAIPRRILNYLATLARSNSYRLTSGIETSHKNMLLEADSMRETIRAPNFTYDERHTSLHPQDKRSPHLVAKQWVIHSRWNLDSAPPSFHSFTYGSKFIGMTSRTIHPDTINSSITVFDFNICNERRGFKLYQPNVRPRPEIDDDGHTNWDYDEGTSWPVYPREIEYGPTTRKLMASEKPFLTSLKYRKVETELCLPWDSAMIDGERIIGLEFKDSVPGCIDFLDVLVI